MRAHCFQHVPFEGPGSIGTWLDDGGHRITATRFFERADFPDPDMVDLLVVMGGPMSVNDGDRFPWLAPEKRFIQKLIATGKPVLGICLGAQLIASALGAAVRTNRCREIGWFPVQGVRRDDSEVFPFPATVKVFHWHGETFDLPAGAVPLARSEGCVNQAFQVGRRVIGLQFHLETTPDLVRGLVSHCREELIPGEYVQTEEDILSAGDEKYRKINLLMKEILTFLIRC